MSKKFTEMSKEELWQLFPIELCPPNSAWNTWYDEEKTDLTKMLPKNVQIYHIGSTAIENIWAKPIIDLLIESNLSDFSAIDDILLKNGYLCMNTEKSRKDYNKGYTEKGFSQRVFHLHLRVFGDHDELYFRDYLNIHPKIAVQYEDLKLHLWKQFEHNRDKYTESKGDFIQFYTIKAKNELGNRYEKRQDDDSENDNRLE